MTRGFFFSLAAILVVAVSVLTLAAQTTFLFKHPKVDGVRVVIDRQGGAVVAPEYLNPAGATAPDAPKLPRASVPEKSYDFGIMNPLTEGVHEFKIKNVGTAPLLLDIESTTCKCTVGGLSKKEVEPGGETTVTLQWNTGRFLFFTHGAVLKTNDAFNRRIELIVDGKVRVLIGASVKELIVPNIEPGKPQDAEFLLYSQLWDDFEIKRISCGIPDLEWSVTPVDPTTEPALDAKAVRRIRVTVPGTLASGRFADNLLIYAERALPKASSTDSGQPTEEAADANPPAATGEDSVEKERFELSMHGTVLRRFALYGPAVRSDGVIELGDIQQGKGKKFVFRAKLRDAEASLGKITIQTTPSFLQVSLKQHEGDSAVGLYDMIIEVPASAPVCQYLGSPQGELTIQTEHPRLGEIKYPVQFVVRP